MDRMVRKAQLVEKRVAEVRKELSKRVFGGEAEGLVKAAVNGDHEVVSLEIGPEAMKMGPERLQELVMAAVNAALVKSKRTIDEEMARATRGLSVPGL